MYFKTVIVCIQLSHCHIFLGLQLQCLIAIVCTVYKRNRTSYMGDVTGQRITPELQKVGLTTVNQFGNLNIIEPI